LALVLVASYFVISAANTAYATWAHSADLFGSASREEEGGTAWYPAPIDHGPENISNNRFAIWGEYLAFSLDDPLFGKSPRNVKVQVQEQHPDSFIAKRNYGPHSGYVAIVNGTGWLGLATWLGLLVFFIRDLIGYLRRHRQLTSGFIFALTLLLVLLLKAAVNETLFFSYSFYASLFYIILGGLLVLFREDSGAVQGSFR
jgi:O-antigen ligase